MCTATDLPSCILYKLMLTTDANVTAYTGTPQNAGSKLLRKRILKNFAVLQDLKCCFSEEIFKNEDKPVGKSWQNKSLLKTLYS